MSKKITRAASIKPSSFNEEDMTIEVLYSTGARVDRGPFLEDLIVSDDAIDTTRLDAGAVHLIQDHMPMGQPVGVVIGHRVEGGNAYATVKLSSSEANASIVRDILDGIYSCVSVGYFVIEEDQIEEDGRVVIVHKRWQPFEISLTPVPADTAARIRSLSTTIQPQALKENDMAKKRTAELQAKLDELQEQLDAANEAESPEAEAEIVEEIAATAEELAEAAEAESAEGDAPADEETRAEVDEEDEEDKVEKERKRSAAIFALGQRFNVPANEVNRAITAGKPVKDFLMTARNLKESNSPAPLRSSGARVEDNRARRSQHAEDAIYALLSGQRAQGEFAGARVRDIAAASVPGLPRFARADEIFDAVMRSGMHTSSDFSFSSALAGGLRRRAKDVMSNIEVVLQSITTSSTLPDFRAVETYSVGSFPELRHTPEGGEYEFGSLNTGTGKLQVMKYGRILNFSFEAFVNDDLRMIDSAVRGIASRSVQLRNRLIHEALTARPLADGNPVFHASRGNIVNGPLDLVNLSKARAALRKLKDIDGNPIGLSGSFLVVGADNETVADQLVSPITAAVTGEVNPMAGKLQVIVNPLIEGNEAYLLASPNVADSIEVAELAGHSGLDIQEYFDPKIDSFSNRVREVVGVGATGANVGVKIA